MLPKMKEVEVALTVSLSLAGGGHISHHSGVCNEHLQASGKVDPQSRSGNNPQFLLKAAKANWSAIANKRLNFFSRGKHTRSTISGMWISCSKQADAKMAKCQCHRMPLNLETKFKFSWLTIKKSW